MFHRQAGILVRQGMGSGHRLRVPVEDEKASPGAEPGQESARMPTPAKGAIEIDPVGANRQRIQALLQQNGPVPKSGHEASLKM